MPRARTVYVCSECGASSAKWLGRCTSCEAWGSLVEELTAPSTGVSLPASAVPIPIGDVDIDEWRTRSTGVPELDRVLGGGLVPGSVTLLGGEPGIGKSTVLLQALGAMAKAGATCLLVTAEESAQQVRQRAERLGVLAPSLYLMPETVLPHVLSAALSLRPDVLVVDSIQTIHDPELGSAPGSVAQVRDCAHALVRAAKLAGTATLLVGHVTKEGGLAGPRVLEHVVDTVLSFEGDRHHALRLLRAVKHRFGGTDELGLFEMTSTGLAGVADPSGLFLADRHLGVAGSVVVPTIEGARPLLVEVQALVSKVSYVPPRRSAQGLDAGRLALLLAVLERRQGLPLGGYEVHVSAVGGVRLTEPGADLAVALALASSYSDKPVADDMVACAEVGLGGELRQASGTPRRLAEAARLGFRAALVAESAPPPPPGIELIRAGTLREAIDLAGCG